MSCDFENIAKRIKENTDTGSIKTVIMIDEWREQTKRLKQNKTCTFLNIACINCPIVCQMLTINERNILLGKYLNE